MNPLAALPLLLGVLVARPQDDAVDAKIGQVDPHRPIGAVAVAFPAPTLDRCAVSYRHKDQSSFVLENGFEQPRPVRFLGWKLPERKSVLLAWASEQGGARKLLLGGEAAAGLGEVWDALLLKEGTQLALVVRTPSGMVLEGAGEPKGPYESIDFFGRVQERPCYVSRRQGKSFLHVGDREFPLEGLPAQVVASPDLARVAWVELLPDRRQRAVVDGTAGEPCEQVVGLTLSPNGAHVACVTRDRGRYRGWVDGQEIRSDHSVVGARVFNDGTPAAVEVWVESPRTPAQDPSAPPLMRGRVLVGERREERVLPQAVSTFEYLGEHLLGAGRAETSSVLVRVPPSGPVSYFDVRGRVGRIVPSPGGDGFVYSAETPQGIFVHGGSARSGPYDSVSDFFYLHHTRRFGYVAAKGSRVLLVVGDKTYPLALNEVVGPVRISKTELTAAVVGVQVRGARKEIWVRVVPLD